MKAITQSVYGSTDAPEFADVGKPAAGPDEVLVQVRAAGVDAGVWHLITGMPKLVRYLGFGVRRPKVAVRGREFAGTVESVGANVHAFRARRRGYGTAEGTFAEFAAVEEEKAGVVCLPAAITVRTGCRRADLGHHRAAGRANTANVRPGQRVLIVGASAAASDRSRCRSRRRFGAEVTGVCSTAKVDLVARSAPTTSSTTRATTSPTATAARSTSIIDIGSNRSLSHYGARSRPAACS